MYDVIRLLVASEDLYSAQPTSLYWRKNITTPLSHECQAKSLLSRVQSSLTSLPSSLIIDSSSTDDGNSNVGQPEIGVAPYNKSFRFKVNSSDVIDHSLTHSYYRRKLTNTSTPTRKIQSSRHSSSASKTPNQRIVHDLTALRAMSLSHHPLPNQRRAWKTS